MIGLMKAAVFMFYTYCFIIGAYFIQIEKINNATGKPYSASDVLAITIALITGFMTLIAALPSM